MVQSDKHQAAMFSTLSKNEPGKDRTSPGHVEFRIVAHHHHRYSLKLEHIFWKIIELAAGGHHQRVGPYLGEILEKCPPNANRTSAARVHAAEWLSRKLIETSAKSLSANSIRDVIRMLPMPAFCVDHAGKVVDQNHELLECLQGISDPSSAKATVHISFGRAWKAVYEELANSQAGFLQETAVITSGDRRAEKRARVAGLETADRKLQGLLVILLPEGTS